MAERWTLAQVVAWVARRRAVPFDAWDDDLFPPREACAPTLKEGYFSPSAANAIAAQDDGIGEAMHAAALQVKDAAAAGAITLHGRQVDQNLERAADVPISTIPAAVFTIPCLGLYLADGRIGPAEVGMAPGATATAWDMHTVPRWLEVTADSSEVQKVWPPVNDIDVWMFDYASEFLAKHGRPPFRDKDAVPDAMAAGFPMDPARKAYARLPDNLKNAARKPKGTTRKKPKGATTK